MKAYTLTFSIPAQLSRKPAIERRKFVTVRIVLENLPAEVVTDFAEGHKAVELVLSDGSNVDIGLRDTVKGRKAGDSVPSSSLIRTAQQRPV